MDFSSIAAAVSHDLSVEIPDPLGLKSWRQSWTERALGDSGFESTFSQLYAVEFFAKSQGLPGVKPQSHLDTFLTMQSSARTSLVARDRTLSCVTDGCRWLLGEFSLASFSRSCTHGPGVTVDGLTSFDKWLFKLPSHELADAFDPLFRYARVPSLLRMNRYSEVPKTSWSMRGICIEESSAQFLQQGIGRTLRRGLLHSGLDLRNQWKTNIRKLQDPQFHTVDLSAASDSISKQFVRSVLIGPKLERWEHVMSEVRAKFALIKDDKGTSIVELETFASMGNGFCFQLLSFLCSAMCIAAIREANPSFPWNRGDVLDEFHKHFSVYGDDIVVHERYRPALYYVLSACGFSVNTEKSSTDGAWRESCGAYVKHSPARRAQMTTSVPRLRNLLLDTPESLVSACSLQRRLKTLGWDETSSVLCEQILSSSKGHVVTSISDGDFNKFPSAVDDPFGSSLVVVDRSRHKSILRPSVERSRSYLRAKAFTRSKRSLNLADLSAVAACLAGGGFLPQDEQYGNACVLQCTRVYV